MKKKKNLFFYALGLVVFVNLAGCGTPKGAKNLAKETSGNASKLSIHISRLASVSNTLADKRIRVMARQSRLLSVNRNQFTTEILANEKSGDTKRKTFYQGIRSFSENISQGYTKALKTEDAKKETLRAQQEALTGKVMGLSEVAKGLNALAEEEDLWDRLKTIATFAGEVNQEYSELKKASEKAKDETMDKIGSKKEMAIEPESGQPEK